MHDVIILKTTDKVGYGVDLADAGEKTVAKTLPL